MDSSRIDFSEPISKVVERLVQEHRELYPKLDQIQSMSVPRSIEMLQGLKKTILHHAVEEEARVIRAVIEITGKDTATRSINIMQEHRWVVDFLDHRLNQLNTIEPKTARSEIDKFVNDLKTHFAEEEAEVFPLALKSHTIQ